MLNQFNTDSLIQVKGLIIMENNEPNQNSDDKPESQQTTNTGCLAGMLTYGGIFLLAYIIGALNDYKKGLAGDVFAYFFGGIFVLGLGYYVFGSGIRNAGNQLKNLVLFLVVAFFLLTLLSQCSGGSGGGCAYRVGCW
jgi:hypothetical protein